MQQRPLVYVSRISNLSDARYCAGMGADLLGFVMDPADPDYVNPETYQQLVGWVSGPERVIELGQASYDESAVREQYAPHYLHVAANRLKEFPVSSWKLIVEVPHQALETNLVTLKQRPDIAFIFIPDLDQPLRQGMATEIPILAGLAGAPESPLAHLQHVVASGLVLRGSRETAPGLKDYDHLSQVLEALNS